MSVKVSEKLKVNQQLPTEQVLQKAAETIDITDSRGRIISLRKPGVLAQYRIVEMVGGEAASNNVYMGMVMPVAYVVAINGEDAFFNTKAELEALIQLLDEDGISAVMEEVTKSFSPPSPDKTKKEIKK